VDVVKKTMHPLGNRLFGRPLVIDNDDTLNIRFQIDSFETVSDKIYDTIKIDEAPYTIEIYWDSIVSCWRYVSDDTVYVL
jgi:hypothetical protein